jgi:PilZ domain
VYTKKPFEQTTASPAAPADRRTVRRRHLIYYLRVWDLAQDSAEVLGYLVDITTEGLLLISERPIPLDQVFTLEMRWQDEQQGDQSLRFRARSLWASPDVNPSFYDTGFRLEGGETANALAPIQELIGRYGFQD